jgi:17beta-estradiol 17-dehydrogenase / very-long-chain 3-oxoacyl-CoA reductase
MAFEFAKQGMNVMLISRSREKLDEVAAEMKAKYPKIDVRVLVVDFSSFDAVTRVKVDAELKNLDIGVLVNNVGISYPFTMFFHELSDENVEQLLTLNVNSTTWMSRIVLPGMLARKRGAIVNMGSGILRQCLHCDFACFVLPRDSLLV